MYKIITHTFYIRESHHHSPREHIHQCTFTPEYLIIRPLTSTHTRLHTHQTPRGPSGTAFVLESGLWLLPISRAEETDLKCDDTMVFSSHRPARPQNHRSQVLRSHQSANADLDNTHMRSHTQTQHALTYLHIYASCAQTLEVQRCTNSPLIKSCYECSSLQTGKINGQIIIITHTAFKTMYHIY